jgi:hypothetical protein
MVGGFEFDAACTAENALARPLWRGHRTTDSLTLPWLGRIWCNPPYSLIGPWVDPFLSTRSQSVMLIPSPNGEARYDRLCREAHEIHIIGRVGFINADGERVDGNPRGSSYFITNYRPPGTRSIVTLREIEDFYRAA